MASSESGDFNPAASSDAADAAFDSAFTSEIAKVETAAPEPVKEGSTPSETASGTPASTETASAVGSTPPAEAVPVAPGTEDAPEYQNLLAKYGGDKNAAAKSYWETAKSASQLKAERDALAQEIAALKAGSTPAPKEIAKTPEPEVPSDLRWYDENIRAVENAYLETTKEKKEWGNRDKQLDVQIRDLRRKLSSNDLSLDKDALNTQLIAALDDKDAISNYLASLDAQIKSQDKEWVGLKQNRSFAAKVLEQDKALTEAREAKAREQEEHETSQFQTQWFGTIDKVAKDASIIPADLSQGFQKYVKQAGKAYVADGTPILDVEKFVRDSALEYVGEVKKFHEAQSRLYGQQKKADASVEAPTGANAFASETKRQRADWTQEQWAAYEEQIQL